MASIRFELNSLISSQFTSRKSSAAGAVMILSNIGLATACAFICEKFSILFPECSLALRSFGIIFIGTRWRALGNMMHECAHGVFVAKAQDNTSFGQLIASLELSSFKNYIKQHVSHHAYLGNPERDLDYISRRTFLNAKAPAFMQIVRIIFLSSMLIPLWLNLVRPVVWTRACPYWANMLRIVGLGSALAALCLPTSREIALVYLFIPYLTAYQWLKIFSDCADHLFLYGKHNPLERSRNHLLPLEFLNWLFFPRNDAYHLLHHLFPSMPTHHYPRAHKMLLEHPWYAQRSHSFFERGRTEAHPVLVSRPK